MGCDIGHQTCFFEGGRARTAAKFGWKSCVAPSVPCSGFMEAWREDIKGGPIFVAIIIVHLCFSCAWYYNISMHGNINSNIV